MRFRPGWRCVPESAHPTVSIVTAAEEILGK
jgi:hypothetical protein